MPKRASSPITTSADGSACVAPLKLQRIDDTWTVPLDTPLDSNMPIAHAEPTIVTKPNTVRCIPTPKTRISQSYCLSFNPKLEATIGLRGNQPEVRFADSDLSICLSGKEFLRLANCHDQWPANPVFLNRTRLEPLQDGCFRFARYEKLQYRSPVQGTEFLPTTVFYMPAFAVNRLKAKLDVMVSHLTRISDSESSINTMFASVVRAYKLEYTRMDTFNPITDHLDEISRLVESHVPASYLVKDFQFNSAGTCWNLYSLLSSVLAQKQHIRSLLVE